VTLPEVELDDRRFQDLVSEARTRIHSLCPEWTEHNVSDPGITLIELFAWMTDLTLYRLNRIPDKVHLQLLSLLGVKIRPPTPARTDVRFMLAAPPDAPVTIAADDTEVATLRTASDEAITFGLVDGRTIEPLPPVAFVLLRADVTKTISVDAGAVRPLGDDRAAFASPPQEGDALHLGFSSPIDRLVMRLEVEADSARGAGVDPFAPPLVWEISSGEEDWLPAEVLEDTTGGFNFGSGRVVLQLPHRSTRAPLGGERLYWLRCRVLDPGPDGAGYQQPPEIESLAIVPIGALLPAEHAMVVDNEIIGTSDGTAGQTFAVDHPPMLVPRADHDRLEVRLPDGEDWEPWELRESFLGCGPQDRVWTCDPIAGCVELAPAVRDATGGWQRLGAIPPAGALLRLSRYRHGGGLAGNVSAGTLTVLQSGPPGIASISNPGAAWGGVDAEDLSQVRVRAALELRGRHRAVTAEDFEHLAREATPRVARSVCIPAAEGGAVTVRVLPHLHNPDRPLTWEELQPDRHLLEEVAAHLDDRRLLGSSVHVAPVRLRPVSVVAELQAQPLADVERIRLQAEQSLYRYINPLVGGTVAHHGTGWPFGRSMNVGELYGILHAIVGVEYVRLLRLYEIDLRTGVQAERPLGTHLVLEPDELVASGRHVVRATARGI
jgi:predicted phage baseplate assembly protein